MSDKYNGPERRSNSWGRRDHDDICHENQKNMKEWVSDKVCIAKKEILSITAPTRFKVIFLWSVLGAACLIAAGSAGTVLYGAMSYAQEKATMQSDIRHNEEAVDRIAKDHQALVGDVGSIKEDVNKMKVEQAVQGEILKGIAEKLRVPIPNQ